MMTLTILASEQHVWLFSLHSAPCSALKLRIMSSENLLTFTVIGKH
jgi:hypothetical protein